MFFHPKIRRLNLTKFTSTPSPALSGPLMPTPMPPSLCLLPAKTNRCICGEATCLKRHLTLPITSCLQEIPLSTGLQKLLPTNSELFSSPTPSHSALFFCFQTTCSLFCLFCCLGLQKVLNNQIITSATIQTYSPLQL